MIFEFRNDSRVKHNPSYAESRLTALNTLQQIFSTLLENKTLPALDRAFYVKELRKVRASISGLQRNAA